MARPLSISPDLVGEPFELGPDVDSAAALSARLGLEEPAGVLPIAPGVVLAHSLARPSGAMVLRWVRLPHTPRLAPDLPPAEVAAVLTAPVSESGRAIVASLSKS